MQTRFRTAFGPSRLILCGIVVLTGDVPAIPCIILRPTIRKVIDQLLDTPDRDARPRGPRSYSTLGR
jgi:hypothetical protein